jgi:hypothetical protein
MITTDKLVDTGSGLSGRRQAAIQNCSYLRCVLASRSRFFLKQVSTHRSRRLRCLLNTQVQCASVVYGNARIVDQRPGNGEERKLLISIFSVSSDDLTSYGWFAKSFTLCYHLPPWHDPTPAWTCFITQSVPCSFSPISPPPHTLIHRAYHSRNTRASRSNLSSHSNPCSPASSDSIHPPLAFIWQGI